MKLNFRFNTLILLGLILLVNSCIYNQLNFNKEKEVRESIVIKKINDIKLAQLSYKKSFGHYSDNFDELIEFAKQNNLLPNKNYELEDLPIIPYSNGDIFNMDTGTITRGGLTVYVFEVKAPYSSYLKGMDKKLIREMTQKDMDLERYPGLKVGSLTVPSISGNWE